MGSSWIAIDSGVVSECRVLVPGTGHDDVLKVVDLPVVHNDQCRQLHRGSLHISERNICAGGRRNEGVCEVGRWFGFHWYPRGFTFDIAAFAPSRTQLYQHVS